MLTPCSLFHLWPHFPSTSPKKTLNQATCQQPSAIHATTFPAKHRHFTHHWAVMLASSGWVLRVRPLELIFQLVILLWREAKMVFFTVHLCKFVELISALILQKSDWWIMIILQPGIYIYMSRCTVDFVLRLLPPTIIAPPKQLARRFLAPMDIRPCYWTYLLSIGSRHVRKHVLRSMSWVGLSLKSTLGEGLNTTKRKLEETFWKGSQTPNERIFLHSLPESLNHLMHTWQNYVLLFAGSVILVNYHLGAAKLSSLSSPLNANNNQIEAIIAQDPRIKYRMPDNLSRLTRLGNLFSILNYYLWQGGPKHDSNP